MNGASTWLELVNQTELVQGRWQEKGTCSLLPSQDKDESLTLVGWADNNFHCPAAIDHGLKRKHQDPVSKRRALDQRPVDCPVQVKSHCKMLHLADKGDCAEAECDLAGESHNHGWMRVSSTCISTVSARCAVLSLEITCKQPVFGTNQRTFATVRKQRPIHH